jgi:hypothetical protein
VRITVQRTRRPRRDVEPSLSSYLRDIRAEDARAARERRLAALERSIAALERWHHEWRLTHDAGYRELHPGAWCTLHRGLSNECFKYQCDIARRVRRRTEERLAYQVDLTPEERQAATRRIAAWGRGNAR